MHAIVLAPIKNFVKKFVKASSAHPKLAYYFVAYFCAALHQYPYVAARYVNELAELSMMHHDDRVDTAPEVVLEKFKFVTQHATTRLSVGMTRWRVVPNSVHRVVHITHSIP